jgi:hypothetical protein
MAACRFAYVRGSTARGTVFVMRWLLPFVLVGCANVASEPPIDAGEDVEDTAEPPRWDASEPFDYGARDPLADATPVDGATCATRTDACGTLSSDPLDRVLSECLKVHWTCGMATASIDSDGCVTAIAFEKDDPKFEACVVAELATKRFACLMAGTRRWQFESCTVK